MLERSKDCRERLKMSYLNIKDHWNRTIVVGDIHGCIEEFRALLDLVSFATEDLLVCVGDFMDRGPGSWELAQFFRDTPNAYSALGNHERRIAGVVKGASQPAWSQKHTLSLIDEQDWEPWGEYLGSLPAVIETDHAIVTHARLDPSKTVTDQDPYFTAAVGGPAVKIPLDSQGVPIWFREIAMEKPICMGHVSYDCTELVTGMLFALDTKAVKGGCLTAVVFPEKAIFQVESACDYHRIALAKWRKDRYVRDGDPSTWPLAHIATVLDVITKDNPELEDAIEKIHHCLARIDYEELFKELRNRLLERFGPVPSPGPERGEYYKRVKHEFEERGHRFLVARILAERSITVAILCAAFPKSTLETLPAMLLVFGEAVRG